MVIFVQRLTQGCSLCSCQPLRSSWSTLVHHSRVMSEFGQRNFATIKGKSSPQPSKALDESMGAVSRTRNIGIIAHIDAGKTTTTERMLFYSGASESIGEVHTGDTITDYMDQERERGITITSASVTFPWRKHKINLLDTPGHVDFTIEVERCLSVLDSAVVILDSTAGVEAQTNTVWQQAERYNIPKIVYLNKMDKPANDVDKCLKSLEALECIPVPIQLPLFKDNKFIGIYDVISPSCWKWNFDPIKQGLEYDVEEITSRHEKYEIIMQRREDLISHLADMDDQMSELVLNNDSLMNIDSAQIINSLRRSVIKNQIIPVLLGSSYKNIGVQPLMDAILRYLPSPLEKPNPIATYYKGNFCASAFKVIHHKNLGPLTFIRVFSGRITPQEKVYNLNRDTVERISKIYLPMADDFHEINVASLGHIVAVSGLTSSVTSDTLTSSKSAADEARACFARENSLPVEESSPVLASINIPEPVFFCTIEAPSMSKQKELDIALDKLQREDPSLRVNYDPNTDQTILSGMGELHLEIIRERIRRDFNIDVSMGKLRVSYREYPKDTLEGTMSKEKNFGGVKNHVTINLRLRPSENFESKFKLKVIVDQDNDLGKLRTDRLRAIKHGVGMALNFGPLASFPVHGVDVDLLDFKCTSATLQSFVSSVTSECVAQLLKKGGISLLEPIMQLQVICPEVYYNRVMNDLIARRGQLISMTAQKTNKIITFLVPLVELVSYSTFLRTITSGTAFFTMQIDCYRKLSDTEQAEAMEKMFGF